MIMMQGAPIVSEIFGFFRFFWFSRGFCYVLCGVSLVFSGLSGFPMLLYFGNPVDNELSWYSGHGWARPALGRRCVKQDELGNTIQPEVKPKQTIGKTRKTQNRLTNSATWTWLAQTVLHYIEISNLLLLELKFCTHALNLCLLLTMFPKILQILILQ